MIKRLDHIGIAVKNLDEAVAKYGKLLGLKPSVVTEVPREKVKAALLPADDFRLELLEGTAPDSVITRFIERHGEGQHHLCVEVDDIEREVAEVKQRGAEIVGEGVREGLVGKVAFVHPKSARGVLWELAQISRRDTPKTKTGVRHGHVAIAVKNEHEATAEYQKHFGLHLALQDFGAGLDINRSYFDLENGDIELMEQVHDGIVTRFVEKNGEGFYCVYFTVEDRDVLTDRLKAEGVRLIEDGRTKFIHPRESHGVLIALTPSGGQRGG